MACPIIAGVSAPGCSLDPALGQLIRMYLTSRTVVLQTDARASNFGLRSTQFGVVESKWVMRYSPSGHLVSGAVLSRTKPSAGDGGPHRTVRHHRAWKGAFLLRQRRPQAGLRAPPTLSLLRALNSQRRIQEHGTEAARGRPPDPAGAGRAIHQAELGAQDLAGPCWPTSSPL